MIRSCEPVWVPGLGSYPNTKFPVPLTVLCDPDPFMICRFTAANRTVGLPPTPSETYVGARTAVVPVAHDGAVPVPPDTTSNPVVVGMHSHPGVSPAANAAEHTQPKAAATQATKHTLAHITTPFRSTAPPICG